MKVCSITRRSFITVKHNVKHLRALTVSHLEWVDYLFVVEFDGQESQLADLRHYMAALAHAVTSGRQQ